jgi:hypothetical protein
LIQSSWLKSWRKYEGNRDSKPEHFFIWAEDKFYRLLAREDVKIRIAHSLDNPGLIYGWVCFHSAAGLPVVHYCYTKAEYRRRRVAKRLLSEIGVLYSTPVVYTCKTNAGEKIAPKFAQIEYVPVEELVK